MILDFDQIFSEQNIHDRHQEQRIGGRTNGNPLIGFFGSSRATRVDDNDFAAASTNRFNTSWKIGGGTHASVRCIRICPQNHQVIGAIEVGDGHRNTRAKHVSRCDLFGQLINGRGTKSIMRTETL